MSTDTHHQKPLSRIRNHNVFNTWNCLNRECQQPNNMSDPFRCVGCGEENLFCRVNPHLVAAMDAFRGHVDYLNSRRQGLFSLSPNTLGHKPIQTFLLWSFLTLLHNNLPPSECSLQASP